MANYYTYNEIVTKAKNIKTGVEKQYKLVENAQWGYFIAKAILSPKTNVNKWYIKPASSSSGDSLSRQIVKKDYLDMAKRFVKYCDTNKQMPNFISVNNKKVKVNDYVYMFARILVYYNANKALPNYANVNSKAFVKPTESKNEVYEYFTKVFGKVNTIDDALAKVKEKGYSYYYDDVYSNKTSIDRMKANKGVNCTDSCHVFWNIGKALGYEVKCIHVKCSGGDGHVRLQFKHKTNTKGNWINRDPAAILSKNGQPLSYIWCASGTKLAENPKWFLDNLYR